MSEKCIRDATNAGARLVVSTPKPAKLEKRQPNLVNSLIMARLGHRLHSALRSRRACPPWPTLGLKKGPETSPFVSTLAENEGVARPAPNLERAKPGPCSPPPAQPPANRQLCSPWLAALAEPPLSSIQPSKTNPILKPGGEVWS